tara:strand:+ start:823 stop:1080 length:258 start_codon:yes stop_codon:yes gene_type:complete
MKITDILDAKLNLRMEGMDLEHDVKMIEEKVMRLHMEMEQGAEAEGGPICDQYADELDREEKKMMRINKRIKELLEELDELETKY